MKLAGGVRLGADVWSGLVAAGLFGAAAVAGALLGLAGRPVHAGAAPLFGHWLPHLGPGTPLAFAVAGLVVWRGPDLAGRLRWRPLLALSYVFSIGWIFSLALVDGWQRGLAMRLTTTPEYLGEVGGVTDVPAMLRGFAGRILDGAPDSWTTHVAGHPPGALLVFVGLDRIGLGGGGWAAVACVLVGAAVAVAVPVTVRALGEEAAARAAMPFLVLFPGAVWIGVSADGLFAGVAAIGLALLAVGLARPSRMAAWGAGVLLAGAAYLSYGLILLAPLAVAIVLLARRSCLLLWTVLGVAVVVVAFTMTGFDWLDGYHLVRQRYYQGLASRRPYGYWVWADLGAFAVAVGPAAAAILRRAVSGTFGPASVITRRCSVSTSLRAAPLPRLIRDGMSRTSASAPLPRLIRDGISRSAPLLLPASVLLPLAAMVAVVFADLSGLSKAEVERIWLPFGVWLPAGAVLLPVRGRRGWLAVQAVVALLVNHLVLTGW